MTKRHNRGEDRKYHINGHKYDMLLGSRAQVWHGTAYKTAGGLNKAHLNMNKHGRIVSKKKSATAKKENRLVKAGYVTKKGVFGSTKKGGKKGGKKNGTRRRRH